MESVDLGLYPFERVLCGQVHVHSTTFEHVSLNHYEIPMLVPTLCPIILSQTIPCTSSLAAPRQRVVHHLLVSVTVWRVMRDCTTIHVSAKLRHCCRKRVLDACSAEV